MSEIIIYVIADIKTGLYDADVDVYRDKNEALKEFKKFDGSKYRVMTEKEADKINESYIYELIENDESTDGLATPNNEDKIADWEREIEENARDCREAEEEGWRCR